MSKKLRTVTVIVAAHKAYRMPDDPMYLPVHVGAEGKKDENGNDLDLGFQKDNVGDNISYKNSSYSELTGLYWAWKHLDADYLGLVHYRRYLGGKRRGSDPFDRILTLDEIRPMLGRYKVFVPKKQYYVIETLYSHYAHTHYSSQLDAAREIISERTPEYLDSFDRVMKHKSGYMFNMMIMRRGLFRDYCSWLFPILEALETRVDTKGLDAFQMRFYGRVSEILFNVWLDRQNVIGRVPKSRIKELPLVYMEKIQWGRKINSFIRAKFLHEKYTESF